MVLSKDESGSPENKAIWPVHIYNCILLHLGVYLAILQQVTSCGIKINYRKNAPKCKSCNFANILLTARNEKSCGKKELRPY